MKGFPGEDLRVLARIQSVLATARKSPELFSAGEEPAPAAGGPPATPAAGPTVEEKDGSLFVGFGRRTYRVRGLTARNLEHLRVNVKVDSSDGNHLDTLDLYSAKARTRSCPAAAK